MARNIKSDEDRRTIVRRARFNTAEDDQLQANAAAAQCADVSKFLRLVSLGQISKRTASATEKALVTTLNDLANLVKELRKNPDTPEAVYKQVDFLANAVHMVLKQ